MAYHLHWSYEDVMLMEHAERQEWVDEVARINMRLNTIGAAETTDSLPSAGLTALVDEA